MTSSDEKLFGDVGRKEAKPGHDIVHNAKQSEAEHVSRKKWAQPSKENLEALRKIEQEPDLTRMEMGWRGAA